MTTQLVAPYIADEQAVQQGLCHQNDGLNFLAKEAFEAPESLC